MDAADLDTCLPRRCRTRRGHPKAAFRTAAEAAAHTAARRHGVETYWCRHCGNYHLGHQPRPDRRGLTTRIRDALRSSQ